jgi:hypothetical protein
VRTGARATRHRVRRADRLRSPRTGFELPAIERASLHLLQLYDLCDAIDLERARGILQSSGTRMRPVASRGASIVMPQLPLIASLPECRIDLLERAYTGRITARLYDLGIIALMITVSFPTGLTWDLAADLVNAVQNRAQGISSVFEQALATFRETLQPAFQRSYVEARLEDYTVLTLEQLGSGRPASQLAGEPAVLRVALGERRPLSHAAGALATSLSYYEDDLILLTWTAALVVEPETSARDDALFLLEFANVQLLAFRSYDAQVERDLAQIAPRIERLRRPRWWMLGSTTRFLHEIHSLITDTTELSARVENALKVTEDVYWNRVFAAALHTLRVNIWRAGLAESLDALRQTAALLNDEAESVQGTLLELLILMLIAVELVVAVVGLLR